MRFERVKRIRDFKIYKNVRKLRLRKKHIGPNVIPRDRSGFRITLSQDFSIFHFFCYAVSSQASFCNDDTKREEHPFLRPVTTFCITICDAFSIKNRF